MIPRLLLGCGLLLILTCCSRSRQNEAGLISVGDPRHDAVGVSIIQLISSPERYAKKPVRVVGYLNIEFEGNALDLHEEDFAHGLSQNGLWIDAKPEIIVVLKKLSGRYVLIEGVFDATNRGHMSMRSGAVSDVYRATEWPFNRDKK